MLQFYGGGVGVIKLVVTIKVGSGRQVSVPYAFLNITPLRTSYEPHSRTNIANRGMPVLSSEGVSL